MSLRLGFIFLLVLLAGCSPGLDPMTYRSTDPSEYFVYFPADYKADVNWLLFVGVHDEDETGEDCFQRWQPFADDFSFVLLCPTFEVAGGELPTVDSEQRIASILRNLYSAYPFQQQFFIAGVGVGGEFALQYALRYPSAMSGAAALAAERYPGAVAAAKDLPILVLVGEKDEVAVEMAGLFQVTLENQNLPVRVIVLPGEDDDLSSDASRITVEFAFQASRIFP